MRAKILNASAGSGKTYRLAYKYVRDVVEQPERYRSILAVTFTNKATGEMKTRIIQEINALASVGESNYMSDLKRELGLSSAQIKARAVRVRALILHDYSRFTVLTIDRFFQRVLRSFVKELGLDLNYNIEIETQTILDKSADALIEDIVSDADLKEWIVEYMREMIDEGKRWNIRDAILSLGDEVFKDEGREAFEQQLSKADYKRLVGSLTHRAAEARRQMIQAATEAVEYLRSNSLSCDEFKGKSKSPAFYFEDIASGEIKEPTATARSYGGAPEKWYDKKSQHLAAHSAVLSDKMSQLCALYDQNIRLWSTESVLRTNYRAFVLLSDLYRKVKCVCEADNVMPLSETKNILGEFVCQADAPFIYEKVGGRFDYFMIDEFQDTSLGEWRNFLPLLRNAMSQSEAESVLIVGDVKQSIYRWRGGDWSLLGRDAQYDLGADAVEVENLDCNYRSLRRVVEFNNNLFDCLISDENDRLNAELTDAREAESLTADTARELTDVLSRAYTAHSQRPSRKSRGEGYVALNLYDENPPVVDCIKAVIDDGYKPSDVMILVRSHSESYEVATALLDFKHENHDPKYDFNVMTQEALVIGNAPITNFVIALFRLALDLGNGVSRAVYNGYLCRAFDAEIPTAEREFVGSVRFLSVEDALERSIQFYELHKNSDSVAYLQAIHEIVVSFCAIKVGDLSLFLKYWEESCTKKSITVEKSDTTIEISTIHKAKGLENRVVIIPYCNWSLNPKAGYGMSPVLWARESQSDFLPENMLFPVRYNKALSSSSFGDEFYREKVYSHIDNINLLYVALTRASERMYIFIWEKSRKSDADVGGLVWRTIAEQGNTVRLGQMSGRCIRSASSIVYEFGELSQPEPLGKDNDTSQHIVMEDYPTWQCDLRVKLPTDRYTDEGDEHRAVSRRVGIILHKAFENALVESEVFDALESLRLDAVIDAESYESVKSKITQQLRDPLVAHFFDGEWREVTFERDIIVPGVSSVKRPDRVMIDRQGRAVVLDYKFGEKNLGSHSRQVRDYMHVVRQMGYDDVTGYLWYINSGEVVEVDK